LPTMWRNWPSAQRPSSAKTCMCCGSRSKGPAHTAWRPAGLICM
jgi:hypothetical protein